MTDELRSILLFISIMVVFGIYACHWWQSRKRHTEEPLRKSGIISPLPELSEEKKEPDLVSAQSVPTTPPPEMSHNDLWAIYVRAKHGSFITGLDIQNIVASLNLRYGDMDIFHYHDVEDAQEKILLSMANILEPGIFSLDNMDTLKTPGVVFFSRQTNPDPRARGLINTFAYETAKLLDAELLDNNMRPLDADEINKLMQAEPGNTPTS